jgi:hypothetical protein
MLQKKGPVVQFGRDEQFDDNRTIRLKAIELSIESYARTATKLREQDIDPILQFLTPPFFVMLPHGTQPNLLADVKANYFASRELLDHYMGRLWAATRCDPSRTPNDFTKLAQKLVAGEYANRPEPIFDWLRKNIAHLYMIRAVRNELKLNPSNASFQFQTDHCEMKISLPFAPGDEVYLPA